MTNKRADDSYYRHTDVQRFLTEMHPTSTPVLKHISNNLTEQQKIKQLKSTAMRLVINAIHETNRQRTIPNDAVVYSPI